MGRDRVPQSLHKFRKDQEEPDARGHKNKTKNQGREMQRKQREKHGGAKTEGPGERQ